MITQAFTISLICVAVHALFWEGMIFFPIGKILQDIIWLIAGVICLLFYPTATVYDRALRISAKLIKPLFDCLICMSSFWTLLIGCNYYHMSSFWTLLITTLMVCAFNTIFDSLIYYLRDGRKLWPGSAGVPSCRFLLLWNMSMRRNIAASLEAWWLSFDHLSEQKRFCNALAR